MVVRKNIILNENVVIDKVKKTRTTNTTLRTTKKELEFQSNIQKLEKYRDKYLILTKEQDIQEYFDAMIKNGIGAIDTETTGLRFYNNKVVGFCLYTPSKKACYIPVGHINSITNEPSTDNVSVEFMASQFSRGGIKWVFHNAPFDVPMIKAYCDVTLDAYWDTETGARMINSDNKVSHKLKDLYFNLISKDDDVPIHYSDLFKDKTYEKLPIDVVYLYAAGDAYKTYKLYEWQLKYFEEPQHKKMYDTFINLEMPANQQASLMSINGLYVDEKFRQELSVKYHNLLDKTYENYVKIYEKYKSKVEAYRGSVALESPINIKSPKQVQVFLYDILEYKPLTNSRDTGVETLKQYNTDVCKAILDCRKIDKLVNTYIDKMVDEISPITHKVHPHYNSYGTATGRFSSDLPNIQNIPSRDFNLSLTNELVTASEVRKIFIPQENNVFISDDFSKQEPVAMSIISKDQALIDILHSGKDLYSGMASMMFHKPYEECVEHNADGTTNKSGKAIRSKAKGLVLGMNYGMGDNSLAKQLGCSLDEAKEIRANYINTFKRATEWGNELRDFVRKNGYVETFCGNRRYLPEYNLKPYVVHRRGATDINIYDCLFMEHKDLVDEDINKIVKELNDLYNDKQYNKLRKAYTQYSKDFIVNENTLKISTAEREIVNSVIQGSAANATKYAMLAIYKNKQFHELGAKVISQIHDEVLVECPRKNANKVNKLVKETMRSSMIELFGMPIEVDGEIMSSWSSAIEIDDEEE